MDLNLCAVGVAYVDYFEKDVKYGRLTESNLNLQNHNHGRDAE